MLRDLLCFQISLVMQSDVWVEIEYRSAVRLQQHCSIVLAACRVVL
jgi:uncharacterized membrane protein YeiH